MTKPKYLCILMLLVVASTQARNLMEELRSTPEFSKFKAAVETSRILPIVLESRGYTAFVPTNDAMDKYKGHVGEDFVHYHLVNIAHKIQELGETVNSDLTGNPVLYVTRIPSGRQSITGWEENDIYINNAKVKAANKRLTSLDGKIQYLHTIDEVLSPTVANVSGDTARQFLAPDARKVIENNNIFQLRGDFSLREFFNRANELGAMDVFERKGKNTFFIPVDSAFTKLLKSEKNVVDKEVINGHVIPSEALFTRTLRDYTKQHPSLAINDQLEVYISLENVSSTVNEDQIYYVKSSTVKNDATHVKGSTMAKILKANIPVKNGVMHLIDRSLMVEAENIMTYVEAKDGQLTKFHQLIVDYYANLSNDLLSKKDITLFAPSNRAFDLVDQKRFELMVANKEKLQSVLRMHVVQGRLTSDEIVERSKNQIYEEESWSIGRKLYFASNNLENPVPTITIEGGGVNATITTPNVATKNGVIHVVDRIFGIPSQTVREKLATDPKLSSTFELSEQKNWNSMLNNRNKEFTLFVPSNSAWNKIRLEMPSTYKKMFMGDYPTHVRNILQRHMIVNETLTLEELEKLTTNTEEVRDNVKQTQLQMTRGKVYFQAIIRQNFGENDTESTEYFVEFGGISARVIRPNVECVNGIVHVIDRVLMTKSDVTVNGSGGRGSSAVATLMSAVMTVTLAWVLI